MSVLTLQSNHIILLDSEHPNAEAARFSIAPFAELVKTPGPLHHYRLTALSIWNAAAAGWTVQDMLDVLEGFADHPVAPAMRAFVQAQADHYGRLWIEDRGELLALCAHDAALLEQVARYPTLSPLLLRKEDAHTWLFDPLQRGALKLALVQLKRPADDRCAYRRGAPLALELRANRVALRDYQREAIERVAQGGSGLVVLPCGAGKTLVGIGLLAVLKTNALILTPSIVAARQWANELLDRTTLDADDIGEYSGERKQIRSVTIATYQMLIQASSPASTAAEKERRTHLNLFHARDWGLVIYDEAHLLPAPIFRLAAQIQATLRLGLTATLVREDHREGDVFALVGPTRYQAGWKQLERTGWIAEAVCVEIRIGMAHEERLHYVKASRAEQARRAGENDAKIRAAQRLASRHRGDRILVIGQYLAQLKRIADLLHAPLITGRTPNAEREALYERFRRGEISLLVVSKVANYAVDLPDANVAIQVSGTFGSRQEEAQRLGRLLRPKANGARAHFYTLVTRDSVEQAYAAKRQQFLIEQGYEYKMINGIM